MIARLVRRRRWIALTVVGLAIGARAAMAAGLIPCPAMSPAQCAGAAVATVAAASMAAIALRALYLAWRTARAVAALPRVPTSALVRQAARRLGAGEVVCVRGRQPTAFCAGLLRPRIYLTPTFDGPELQAVLAHEHAHARRRDPLRRVLARAAGDVLFYLPLASWWADRQLERSEVAADRAAIGRVGRKALAAALLSAAAPPLGQTPGLVSGLAPGMSAFAASADRHADLRSVGHLSTQARLANLLGEPAPRRRPSRARLLASLTGTLAAVSVMMCLGHALIIALL
ncbi:M56 family metallopeptidase [Nonomuraea sp. NPDC026600]|uniref:M56 family metallopeptidase n=1 Tax=Nonomuraea sp. NPDC026600 TaxID=3155363 RepID=UPI0033C336C9